MILKFPQDFLWGASTSALQVEGNLIHSDWWEWEQRVQPPHFRSGLTCDQYHLYNQDFELAKKLGHNAHRLSVEWSRIEPREGEFQDEEIKHYIEVLSKLKSLNIKVCLTLHHFSNPLWFAQKGGWHSLSAPYYFSRYVQKIAPYFKDYVDQWITINEPAVYVWALYIGKCWPGAHHSVKDQFLTYLNLIRAHQSAYKSIHQTDSKAKVGIANNVASFDVFHHHSAKELFMEWSGDIINNHLFYLLSGKTHDFLGLNYYFHNYFSRSHNSAKMHTVDISSIKSETSSLGWEIYPEGIFDVLTDLASYKLPIYITENGLATDDDSQRVRFLLRYLTEIYHAIQAGANVKGYYHWSFMDNMELHQGYEPRFGLVHVDFKTLERTPKPSAYLYKKIIEQNGISPELFKLLGHGVKAEELLKMKV